MQCTFPYPLQSNALSCSQAAAVAGEFQINTDTGGDGQPTIAALNDGGFVVVWHDSSSPRKNHGRRYDSAGIPAAAGEFQINTGALIDTVPTVAALKDGGFVVVWNDGSAKIQGQMYNSTGGPVGIEFQVNTGTPASDTSPTIAALNDGGFVVVWRDSSSPRNIHGRRYDSAGTPAAAGEFQVNTDTLSDDWPHVAALNDGGFVVVWNDNTAPTKIHGRRYDSAGIPDSISVAPPATLALCDMPQQCYDSSTQGVYNLIGQGTYTLATQQVVAQGLPVGAAGQVCVAPSDVFDPSTEGTYSLTTQQVVAQGLPVGAAGQVCVAPSDVFNPSTEGTYTLATQQVVAQGLPVGAAGQVCVAPSDVFNPSTEGT